MGISEKQKITSFTQLIAWKKGHKLVLKIYSLTDNFPEKERFGLTSQLRRAAVSITSNIAEGFYRSSKLEKRQFYLISLGSVGEIQNQLMIARDIGYIDNENFSKAAVESVVVHKLINGLIKSVSSRP